MSAGNTVRRNGQVEMAAVEGVQVWWETAQQKPQRVQRGVSIDDMRIAAGMDWSIGRSRVRYGEGASQLTWDDHHVLFRKDTKAPLGLVSPSYKVVQPAQILELFRDVTAVGGATLETAGTLFGGRKFWCMARLDGAEEDIGGGDKVLGYLLGITSADGSAKTTMTETSVCVVCNNTAQMALAENGARISIGHRTELTEVVMNDVKKQLADTGKHFKAYVQSAKLLAKTKISTMDAGAFVESLMRDQKLLFAEDPDKSSGYASIMRLFNGAQLGGDLKGRDGTLWGLVNAVTEHVDHHVKAKDQSIALDSMWFGKGDGLKTAAMAKALVLV